MSGTILNFKLYSVLFCVPAACVVGYLIFKKDLMKSGIILAFCLVVSGIFLYYVLSANFNARKNDDNNVDLVRYHYHTHGYYIKLL
jgi:multisubunit Na+/H+ antiporter MnhC subunit